MQDLTTGSLSRHLLKTTSFMLVGMVLQTLYVLVDLYWVGRLGTEAVAAVAVAGNFTFIVLAVSQALGVGTTSLIAQAAGRKDRDEAQHVFGQSQLLALTVAVLFAVASYWTETAYVAALAPDPETARLAHVYLKWFLPAMALQFGLVSMSAALRGTGRFGPGMWVQSGSVILNMVLTPVLMFGWGLGEPMGVAGAALGTLVAIAAGTLGMVFYFLPTDAYLRLATVRLRLDLPRWRAILKVGIPAGAEFAFLAVYLFVVYSVTRPFGAAAQAGFGIGMRVLQSGFLPVVALGIAVGPVAGQNYGARKADRVRATFRDAAGLAAGAMLIFSVIAHFAPEPLLRPFSDDPEVIATAAEYLRIVSWGFVASGVIFVISSMFQAMGNSMPPLLAAGVRNGITIGVLIPLSHVAGFSLHWIWWLSTTAIFVQVLLSLWLLRHEFRTRLGDMSGGEILSR